jgi:hypothetical protein
MACDETRVFVLGGELSPGAQADETKLIYVLDTSMYFIFVMSFGQLPNVKKQSTSITENPTPTLSILVRRPPNPCGSRQRVSLNSSDNCQCRKGLLRKLKGTSVLHS